MKKLTFILSFIIDLENFYIPLCISIIALFFSISAVIPHNNGAYTVHNLPSGSMPSISLQQGLDDLKSMELERIGFESIGNGLFILTDPFLGERLGLAVKAENEDQARSVLPFLMRIAKSFRQTDKPFACGLAVGSTELNKDGYSVFFDAQEFEKETIK